MDNECRYLHRNMQSSPMTATRTQHPNTVASTMNSDISEKGKRKHFRYSVLKTPAADRNFQRGTNTIDVMNIRQKYVYGSSTIFWEETGSRTRQAGYYLQLLINVSCIQLDNRKDMIWWLIAAKSTYVVILRCQQSDRRKLQRLLRAIAARVRACILHACC